MMLSQINSGPVVTAVIGSSKFAWDAFGDSVNVASRMESSGVPGRVHVSRPVYEATYDVYNYEERPPIDIKGKGVMTTYLNFTLHYHCCCVAHTLESCFGSNIRSLTR